MEPAMSRTSLIVALASLISAPIVVHAEPVSFTYAITNIACESRGNAIFLPADRDWCATFPSSFPLIVTFDSSSVTSEPAPGLTTHDFGTPSFSPVPLVLPDLPGHGTTQALAVGRTGAGFHSQQILSRTFSTDPSEPEPWLFFSHLVLLQGFASNAGGDMSAFELASLMREFLFLYVVEDAEEPATLAMVRFTGTAALDSVDQAPVPEPGTVLLVVSCLTCEAFRQRRRRRS
jgi:hypothetical protein